MKKSSTFYSIFILPLSSFLLTSSLPLHTALETSPSVCAVTPLYTYTVAPHKTVAITIQTNGSYHAYLLEELDQDNTLQMDLGVPHFLSPQDSYDVLQRIKHLSSQHQKYYLHLLSTNDPNQPFTLLIGKNLLAGGGPDTPEMQRERQRVQNEMSSCKQKMSALDKKIRQKETLIEDIQTILQEGTNQLDNPKIYQEALQKSNTLETKLTQCQAEISNLQLDMDTWKLQALKYTPTKKSKKSKRKPRKAKVEQYQLNECKDKITKLEKKIVQLQHQCCIITQEKEECYHLLQQIHRFKNRSKSKMYNRFLCNFLELLFWGELDTLSKASKKLKKLSQEKEAYKNNAIKLHEIQDQIDDFQQLYRAFRKECLQNVYKDLENKLTKAQSEQQRLDLSQQRASLFYQDGLSRHHSLYVAIQTNQNTLQKLQYGLKHVNKLIRQPHSTPLTFNQQLVLANYIQLLTNQKAKYDQEKGQHQLHYDHLAAFKKALQPDCERKNHLAHTREALCIIAQRRNSYETTQKALQTLKDKLQESVKKHKNHLSLDALLLLESNILHLEREASNCTIALNNTNHEASQVAKKMQRIIQSIEEQKNQGRSKLIVGGALLALGIGTILTGGLLGAVAVGTEVTSTAVVGAVGGSVVISSGRNDLSVSIEEKSKKELFIEILNKKIASQKKLLQLLDVTCQQADEESTIPTEALTFTNKKTSYLEAQASEITQSIQHLQVDLSYLKRNAPNVKEKYEVDAFAMHPGLMFYNSISGAKKGKSIQEQHDAYLQENRRFQRCVQQCNAITQTLYKQCFQENDFRPTRAITHTATSQDSTKTDFASLSPKQAEARLQAIQRRIDSLEVADKSNRALLIKLQTTTHTLSLKEKNSHITYLRYQQTNIQEESSILETEKNLLKKITESHVLVTEENRQLHKDAYNRRELATACGKLKQQIATLQQSHQTLEKELQITQTALSSPEIRGSRKVLLPLLKARLQSLLSKRSSVTLDLYDLYNQLENHATTIQQREKLARLLSTTSKLVLDTTLTIVITSSTGPFAVILAPAAKAATSACVGKAVEDVVANGGDLTGWQEDFVSWDTFHKVTTTACSSIVTQASVRIVPFATKKILSKDAYKKLSNFMQTVEKDPCKVSLPKLIPTQLLKHFHDNFAGNISSTFVGMGIKSVIESYTGKQLSTGLPTEDPQNPNYATSHPKQSYKEILFNAVKDAALQSCSATAANNVGICYQQHKKKHKGNETLEGYILHKGAHATIGATTAAIRKAKIEKKTDVNEIFHAAVSGATGAVVAEASAEYYQKHFTKKGQELIDSLEDKGIEPTLKNLQKAYNHNLKLSGSTGRLTALTSAYLLDHDIEIANRSAQNAIDNNFAISGTLAVSELILLAIAAGTLVYKYITIINGKKHYVYSDIETGEQYLLTEEENLRVCKETLDASKQEEKEEKPKKKTAKQKHKERQAKKRAKEGSKTNDEEEKGKKTAKRKGGGKNAKHWNPKKNQSASKELEEVKKELNELEKKQNKTPTDKKKMAQLRKRKQHLQNKKNEKGEPHSKKAKGNPPPKGKRGR